MSADGSAFGDGAGGEFLQKATKRAKFESETAVVDSPANIMDGEWKVANLAPDSA